MENLDHDALISEAESRVFGCSFDITNAHEIDFNKKHTPSQDLEDKL